MDEKQSWERRKGEPRAAFHAFTIYYQMPARARSIDAAWRADGDQTKIGKRAPSGWFAWSAKYEWVARAGSYDEYVAAQTQLDWEERRREVQERDWAQANALRDIVDAALPNANQFIRRQTTTLRGTPAIVDSEGELISAGTPDREIVTLSFDITALARVLTDASKLQRLATDEPTDNLRLSGAALDAAIAAELARMADSGKKGDAATPPRDATGGNAG